MDLIQFASVLNKNVYKIVMIIVLNVDIYKMNSSGHQNDPAQARKCTTQVHYPTPLVFALYFFSTFSLSIISFANSQQFVILSKNAFGLTFKLPPTHMSM